MAERPRETPQQVVVRFGILCVLVVVSMALGDIAEERFSTLAAAAVVGIVFYSLLLLFERSQLAVDRRNARFVLFGVVFITVFLAVVVGFRTEEYIAEFAVAAIAANALGVLVSSIHVVRNRG